MLPAGVSIRMLAWPVPVTRTVLLPSSRPLDRGLTARRYQGCAGMPD
jgi:hypothetical protein